ncbi:MAG: ATP-binding cassette domain-containing protein [Provencibacterium sp.]|jgi:ABC-2 type transport system ATP-binding protein|nr:ATP-binding cassette domain-containing protein [Provencibacterium sp.]
MSFIEVNQLCKEYRIAQSGKGISGAVRSLFHREYTVKQAVKNVSFSLEKGEVVGYIGPNGAGKSTTIKMLSGVLIPTSGTARIGDIIPYENRKENAKHIGVVFGQRSQLYWDLPISDTLELYESLYSIPKERFRRNCDFFTELLDMKDFLSQPVRQLSLGQKMKANIAIALLHDPDVVYLDEPTIGLDVTSKKVLRDALKKINAERKTTIILTTHDMDDIEAVCRRLIMIDQGKKLFDGTLADFRSKYNDGFTLKLEFEGAIPAWQESAGYELLEQTDHHWIIKARTEITSKAAMIELIEKYDPTNLYVQEERIEDIVRRAYALDAAV